MTSSPTPPGRVWVWIAVAAVACVWQAPKWVAALRPAPGQFFDFEQEWLSGRNYFTGRPVYLPQRETLPLYTGFRPEREEDMLPWNAHPPTAVLLALPFSYSLSYEDAHLAWNVLSLALFLAAVTIAWRSRGGDFTEAQFFKAVALLATCYPLLFQTYQAQLNGLLVFLVALAWAADRAGRESLAGALVGVAAAVKLVPGFLAVYWLARGRWRPLIACLAAWAALNLAALALFGPDAFATYVTKVIPSVSEYRSSWDNISLTGFWFKLFDPNEKEQVVPLLRSPVLARSLTWATQILVAALVFARCRRAATREQRDHALGLAVVGMLLASPITWAHYLLMLLVPLAVPSTRPKSPAGRTVWAAGLFAFWLPTALLAAPSLGLRIVRQWNKRDTCPEAQPWQVLLGLEWQFYALVAFFLCVYFTFPRQRDQEPMRSSPQ